MYQFQFEYDFQDLLVLNRVYTKASDGRRAASILARVFLILSGVFIVAITALVMILAECTLRMALYFLFGLLELALAIFYYHYNAWISKHLQIKNAGVWTITVDEDGVREHSAKGDNIFPWNVLEGGYHSRGRYFLFIDKKHAVILREQALTQGDPATLRAFLEEKLQKKVKEIP